MFSKWGNLVWQIASPLLGHVSVGILRFVDIFPPDWGMLRRSRCLYVFFKHNFYKLSRNLYKSVSRRIVLDAGMSSAPTSDHSLSFFFS